MSDDHRVLDQDFQRFLSDFLKQSPSGSLYEEGHPVSSAQVLQGSSDHSLDSASQSQTMNTEEIRDDRFEMRDIDPTGMTAEEYLAALNKERKRVKNAKYWFGVKNDPQRNQHDLERRRKRRQRVKASDPEKYQQELERIREMRQSRKKNDPEKYQKTLQKSRDRSARLKEKHETSRTRRKMKE